MDWVPNLVRGSILRKARVEVLGEEEHDDNDNCPTYRERQPCWTDWRLSHHTARATIIPLDWLQPAYTMPTLVLRLLPRRQVLPTGLRVSNPNMAQPSMSRLLPRKGVSRSASMTTLEQAEPMVRRRRAALTGIQESGQVLGLDLRQVPRQNSGRSTHALEHGPA